MFIDADKENYPRYLDWALRLVRPGGLIVADNALVQGRTADLSESSAPVEAMRAFNAWIAGDPRLVSTILPTYDGLAVAWVRADPG